MVPETAGQPLLVTAEGDGVERVTTVDVDGLAEWRSVTGELRAVHQVELRPAPRLRFTWTVTPRLRVVSTADHHWYHASLFGPLGERVDVRPLPYHLLDRPERLAAALADADVLHLHWPEWVTGLSARRSARVADAVRGAGVPVVWTQHNLAPHTAPDDTELYRPWAALAEGVIHHSAWGRDAITARYEYRPDAVHAVIPHGHWGDLMAEAAEADGEGAVVRATDRAAAEAELGVAPCHLRIGVVGAPRPGKDTQLVLDGFAACHRRDLQLLVLCQDGERVPDDDRITALPYEEVPRRTYDRRLAAIDVLAMPLEGGSYLTSGQVADAVGAGHPRAGVALALPARGARRRGHRLRAHGRRPGGHARRPRRRRRGPRPRRGDRPPPRPRLGPPGRGHVGRARRGRRPGRGPPAPLTGRGPGPAPGADVRRKVPPRSGDDRVAQGSGDATCGDGGDRGRDAHGGRGLQPGPRPRDPGAHRPLGTGNGYLDGHEWRRRQDGYLHFATQALDQGSIANVIAHLARDERERDFRFDASVIGPDDFAAVFAKIDAYQDTSDFDMMRLMALWYGYGGRLRPDLRQAIEARFTGFRYWYTDPLPAGVIDEKWFWSENHRLIFHTLEYLAGRGLPDATFGITGETGRTHADARPGAHRAVAGREGLVGLLRVALGRLLRRRTSSPCCCSPSSPSPTWPGGRRPCSTCSSTTSPSTRCRATWASRTAGPT